MKKPKLLIIFTDPHLPYSQSTLQLYTALQQYFEVDIFTNYKHALHFENLKKDYSIKTLSKNGAKATEFLGGLYHSIAKTLDASGSKNKKFVDWFKLRNVDALSVKKYLRWNKYDEIVAVDFLALWCVAKAKQKAHLLSLEIIEDQVHRRYADTDIIKSLIIQSKERKDYLFGNTNIKTFIVQNAPAHIPFTPDISTRNKKHFILCGSALPEFGIFSCLDFIHDYPDYSLTIKGNLPHGTLQSITLFYKHLIDENRLVLNKEYLGYDELNEFVAGYSIGFAFYDFFRFDKVRSFNYYTAPSGKVFQYLNAGVPVIGNNIPGFHFLKEAQAGELVQALTPNEIKAAADLIEAAYETYAKNAKELSKEFDFTNSIKPFINFLSSKYQL